MKWLGRTTRVGDRDIHILSENLTRRNRFTKHSRRWHNNIKILIFLACVLLVETRYNCCAKLCYIGSYLLTPWCTVLIEKLTGLQLVKKFSTFLWNPKVHHRTHKRPPPVPVLGQPNPVHIPTSHLLEIHPNIIHPSTPRSPQWSLSIRFPHQDPYTPPSPHPYSQHNQYHKYLLLRIQYEDSWWWTVSLSETCRVLYQNKVEK